MKPCTKVKHRNQKAANTAAHMMQERTGSICTPHKCDKCHSWHIGRPSMYKNPDMYYRNMNKLLGGI